MGSILYALSIIIITLAIKMDFRYLGSVYVNWTELVQDVNCTELIQDRFTRRTFMSTIMNLQFRKKIRELLERLITNTCHLHSRATLSIRRSLQ
jgi:hypothetical protein